MALVDEIPQLGLHHVLKWRTGPALKEDSLGQLAICFIGVMYPQSTSIKGGYDDPTSLLKDHLALLLRVDEREQG